MYNNNNNNSNNSNNNHNSSIARSNSINSDSNNLNFEDRISLRIQKQLINKLSNRLNVSKDNLKQQRPSFTSLLAKNQPSTSSSLASLLSCQRNVNKSSINSKNNLNNNTGNFSLDKRNNSNNHNKQLSNNYTNNLSNNKISNNSMTSNFDAITLRLLESLFTINERPCSEAIEMIAQRIKTDFTTVAHWFDHKRNKMSQMKEQNRATSLLRNTGQAKNKRKEQTYENNISTSSNNNIDTFNNSNRLINNKNHRTSTESSSADSSIASNLIFPFDASQLLKHLQQQLLQQQQLQQHQLEENRDSIYDDDLDDNRFDDLQQDLPLNDIDYYASSNSAAPSADCEDYDLDVQDYSYEEISSVSEMVRHRRMTMGLSQTKASQSFRAFTGGQCEFADNFIAQFESMQADQQTAKWALRSFGPWLDYIEGELSMGRELLFMAHDDPTRTARRREGRVFTFSEYQRTILENCFAESQYLTPEQFDELSRTIRVPNRSLKTWFKNRRSKQRSQLKASGNNLMKPCNKFVVH